MEEAEEREYTRAAGYLGKLRAELSEEEPERRLDAIAEVDAADREWAQCPCCENDTLLEDGPPEFTAVCMFCSYTRTPGRADEMQRESEFDRAMAKDD